MKAAAKTPLGVEKGNPDPWWESCALQAIRDRAAAGLPFQLADLADVVPPPDHPNRWGAVTHKARAAGLIVKVGSDPSHRGTVAGSLVSVWASPDAAAELDKVPHRKVRELIDAYPGLAGVPRPGAWSCPISDLLGPWLLLRKSKILAPMIDRIERAHTYRRKREVAEGL